MPDLFQCNTPSSHFWQILELVLVVRDRNVTLLEIKHT